MIRLLIADDHTMVREGLKRLVADCAEITVVGEAVDGHQVISRCRELEPDVLLLDISMPGSNFLDLLHRLRTVHPRLRVLVLSVHPEDQYAVRAIRAGAAGYLTKDHSPEELAQAIRRVHQGRRYVTPDLAEQLAMELETDGRRLPHETLSDREYEVFNLLARGLTVKDIAESLSLSPKTVSTYRTRIMAKLRLKDNAALIHYALQHRLMDDVLL